MEVTQVQEITGKEADELESWLKAKDAPEPGDSLKERIIRDPDMPEGVGMKYTSVKSAGWVYVYHTRTGDKSIVNRNMLRTQLQKKLEDGSLAFSLKPPVGKDGKIIKPIPGIIKCLLHPDDLNRQHYDVMGFAICKKANLSSPHSLTQHMRHRHHVEWEAIEKDRTDKEKAEDRTFQKNLYEKLTSSLVKPEVQPEPKVTFVCETCEKDFSTRIALEGHKRSHTTK